MGVTVNVAVAVGVTVRVGVLEAMVICTVGAGVVAVWVAVGVFGTTTVGGGQT